MTPDIFSILAFDRNILVWVVILIVALLVFGNRLPNVAKSLGQSISEFKKGINEAASTGKSEGDTKPADSKPSEKV